MRFGGIIIGRSVDAEQIENVEYSLGDRLADLACATREKYFYRHNAIRLLVWDWILDSMARPNSPKQRSSES
jgi:hypothetical protein